MPFEIDRHVAREKLPVLRPTGEPPGDHVAEQRVEQEDADDDDQRPAGGAPERLEREENDDDAGQPDLGRAREDLQHEPGVADGDIAVGQRRERREGDVVPRHGRAGGAHARGQDQEGERQGQREERGEELLRVEADPQHPRQAHRPGDRHERDARRQQVGQDAPSAPEGADGIGIDGHGRPTCPVRRSISARRDGTAPCRGRPSSSTGRRRRRAGTRPPSWPCRHGSPWSSHRQRRPGRRHG